MQFNSFEDNLFCLFAFQLFLPSNPFCHRPLTPAIWWLFSLGNNLGRWRLFILRLACSTFSWCTLEYCCHGRESVFVSCQQIIFCLAILTSSVSPPLLVCCVSFLLGFPARVLFVAVFFFACCLCLPWWRSVVWCSFAVVAFFLFCSFFRRFLAFALLRVASLFSTCRYGPLGRVLAHFGPFLPPVRCNRLCKFLVCCFICAP